MCTIHLKCVLCLSIFFTLIQVAHNRYTEGLNVNLGEALQFLREYDREATSMCTRVKVAQWNFATNVTSVNRQRMIDEQMLKLKFEKSSWRRSVSFAWSRIPDELIQRQLKMIAVRGQNSLIDDKFNEIHQLVADMKELYNNVKLCPYKKTGTECNLTLDHDVNKIMAQSKDYSELLYYWQSWHDSIGPLLVQKYTKYVQLANQAARLNGFANAGDQMREHFEDDYLQENIAEVISAIMPLYKNLFTYVRRRMLERYGVKIKPHGPLPAHILGDMWGHNWESTFDLVQPFPASRKLDITLDMIIQGVTPLRMFQIAEEYFTSLGLKPMPPEFWKFSMLEKPTNRQVKCTPSAWDFCNSVDYRIKQCTKVTMDDFLIIHREMARVQYYLQYRDQPLLFRNEAVPGFYEALSDAISLSISTPDHLNKIGFYNNSKNDYQSTINFLMLIGLRKIPLIPFAYVIDQWKSRVFNEGVNNMTLSWWELKLQYQGVVPPMPRNEGHFDPGTQHHILADVSYTKYLIGTILQFQLFESLCEIAGHADELHTCNLYRSREAGRLMSDVLSTGSSRKWQDVVKQMTRGKTNRLDAGAIIRYFEPLNQWLKRQNEMESVIGWVTHYENTAMFAQWYQSGAQSATRSYLLLLIVVVSGTSSY